MKIEEVEICRAGEVLSKFRMYLPDTFDETETKELALRVYSDLVELTVTQLILLGVDAHLAESEQEECPKNHPPKLYLN